MKDEFNVIKVNNPDGILKRYEEGLRFCKNDAPKYIKEDPMARQTEISQAAESIDVDKNAGTDRIVPESSSPTLTADNLSSLTQTVTNASSSAASTAASTAASGAASAAGVASGAVSVTTTIGSAIGAVAGVVTTTVVSAAIVVAVFISTLSINLSLVMADIDTLVLQIEMQGAQDEDFESHIIALLEGQDGIRIEQDILPDSLYLTFTDLNPGTEYYVCIRNDDKVFVEKTFITATEKKDDGLLTASFEDGTVLINVGFVALNSDEFYTVTVKNESGKVLFAADGADQNKQFSFTIAEPTNLYFTLSVGGKTYAVYKIEMLFDPVYDLNDYFFTWNDDFTATVTIAEKTGKEPLVIDADVVGVYTDPTCEVDGFTTYTATAQYEDATYNDVKTLSAPGTATGHDFSQYGPNSDLQPLFTWTPIYKNSTNGPNNADTNSDINNDENPIGFTVTATFVCAHDPEHKLVLDAEVNFEDGVNCDEGGIMYYYASVLFNDADYQDEKQVEFGPGHDLVPVFHWIYDGENGYEVNAQLVCKRNDSHTESLTDAEVTTSEGDGYIVYTATAELGGQIYQETKIYHYVETVKAVAIGEIYYIGDTMDIGEMTTYFRDDNEEGHRTSMSGSTFIMSVEYASGASGPNTSDNPYDSINLENPLFVRMDDENGWTVSETSVWTFTPGSDTIIGVTILSGSGTENDPYVLAPVYGKTVTFSANDGLFMEQGELYQYYTNDEIADGVHAYPPNENPEADGRLFIGWFVDADYTEPYDFENSTVTDNITLYAGWIYI